MSSRPKIVFLDAETLGEVPNLSAIHELGDFQSYPNTSPDEVVHRLQGTQVAITNKVVLTAAAIAQLPELRLVCVAATGTNNVDKKAAADRNIPVRNVAGYSTNAVAQLTMAMLITLSTDLIHLNAAVYDGTYTQHPHFSYWRRPFYELSGARFGIIGLGAIGHRVAALATAYGAKVVYHSTSGRNTSGQPYPHLLLDELLRTCEVISIHAPLNEHTKGLIGYQELEKMKPSAYLLNMGRGGIVVEEDLVRGLNDGQLAGAAVDVYTAEPIRADHPFLEVKDQSRLLLTPHIAWASVEARTALVQGVIDNIKLGW